MASRLSRLSKGRNVQAHTDVGLLAAVGDLEPSARELRNEASQAAEPLTQDELYVEPKGDKRDEPTDEPKDHAKDQPKDAREDDPTDERQGLEGRAEVRAGGRQE